MLPHSSPLAFRIASPPPFHCLLCLPLMVMKQRREEEMGVEWPLRPLYQLPLSLRPHGRGERKRRRPRWTKTTPSPPPLPPPTAATARPHRQTRNERKRGRGSKKSSRRFPPHPKKKAKRRGGDKNTPLRSFCFASDDWTTFFASGRKRDSVFEVTHVTFGGRIIEQQVNALGLSACLILCRFLSVGDARNE